MYNTFSGWMNFLWDIPGPIRNSTQSYLIFKRWPWWRFSDNSSNLFKFYYLWLFSHGPIYCIYIFGSTMFSSYMDRMRFHKHWHFMNFNVICYAFLILICTVPDRSTGPFFMDISHHFHNICSRVKGLKGGRQHSLTLHYSILESSHLSCVRPLLNISLKG